MTNIYQQSYIKLEKILGKDWFKLNHVVLKNEPYMQLYFARLDKNRFALAHYFEQNGDLVPDPDIEILVHPETKSVEVLSYQDGYSYQRVYPDPSSFKLVDFRAKKSLNKFLSFWLDNIIVQGFKLSA